MMPEQRDDRERFDPRFDPAFQPGYDADRQGSAPTGAGYGRRAGPPAGDRFAPPPTGALTPPAYGGASSGYGSAPLANGSASLTYGSAAVDGGQDAALQVSADQSASGVQGETDTGRESNADAADLDAPVRGPNPFSIALWVISALLIVGGITIYRSLPGLFADGQADASAGNSFIQLFALGVLAAILIGVGLVGAIGNLVLLAARFDRRR